MRKLVTEYTCDVCGCEVDESIIIPEFIDGLGKTSITVELKPNSEADICIYCFIKAVNKLDPRPKAAN